MRKERVNMCPFTKKKTPKEWCLDMVLGNYQKGIEYGIDKLSESEHHKAYGITIYADTEMIPWYCEIKSKVGFGKPLKLRDIVLYGERLNG